MFRDNRVEKGGSIKHPAACIYIYIYIYIFYNLYVYYITYIHMHIRRERESARERKRNRGKEISLLAIQEQVVASATGLQGCREQWRKGSEDHVKIKGMAMMVGSDSWVMHGAFTNGVSATWI